MTIKTLKKELDRLVQEIVALRDKRRCAYTGGNYKVAGHHLIYKSQSLRLRWELDNLISLNMYSHVPFAHEHPKEFREWLDRRYPGRYERLEAMDEKVHWPEYRLLEILEQLKEKKRDYSRR